MPKKRKIRVKRAARFQQKSLSGSDKDESEVKTAVEGAEDESSNDESISSVLVEEAHMGEDEQDEQHSTTAEENGVKKATASSTSTPKINANDKNRDELDLKESSSPCTQSQDGDLASGDDDEKQFSDWSSEEDDLLAKDEDRKPSRTSGAESPLNAESLGKKSDDEGGATAGAVSETPEANGLIHEDHTHSNILEEAEAISDDDLEALIEEDNEPSEFP